jgi:THAP domain
MRPCNQCCLCTNKYGDGCRVSFFRIPKESERRIKWIEFVREKVQDNNWEPGPHSRICSDHFTPSEFERRCLQDMKNLNIRNILTRTAVPTIVQVKKRSGLAGFLNGLTSQALVEGNSRIFSKETANSNYVFSGNLAAQAPYSKNGELHTNVVNFQHLGHEDVQSQPTLESVTSRIGTFSNAMTGK